MKRYFLFGFLFAATFSFGQAVSSVPVGKNNNGVPTETLVTICATNPGNGTCNSLVTTYTDITLGTSCSGTLGNLNGPGCSNPGYTDVLGNALAYAAAGSYYCQFSGSSTSPHSVPCPAAGAGGGGTLVISAAFGTGSVTAPSPVGTNTCIGNPFMWVQNAAGTYQTQMSIDPSAVIGGLFGTPGFLTNCRPLFFNSTGITPTLSPNGGNFDVYYRFDPTHVISTQWRFENPVGDTSTISFANINQTYSEMVVNGSPTLSTTFFANSRLKFQDKRTGGTKPSSWSAYQGATEKDTISDDTNCTGGIAGRVNGACYVAFLGDTYALLPSTEDETGVSYAAFEGQSSDSGNHATNAIGIAFHATLQSSSTGQFGTQYGFMSEDFGSGANSYDLYLKGTSTTGKNYFGGPSTFAQAMSGLSLTLTDTAANTDLSTSNTTPTVTGASTTVALSTGTPPSNLSGNSWVYTLAATESGAGSNAWVGATVTLSGWTGGATGNNCAGGCPITASTTTTVTITNATGSTTNTGTPVMISTAVSSSPLAKLCGTINSGTAGTLNSIPDCWSFQNVPAAVGPNPITNLTVAHSGSSGAGAFTIATGISGINILAGNYTAAAAQGLLITGRALYLAPASGVAEITNSAATGLTRLDLGLTTSSGPALCVSGTTITVCGGDGTAVGTLSSPNYSSGGTAGISSSGTLCTATFTTVSGLVTACTAASDPRLKNYKSTQHGLADVLRLHPIEWTYNALAHRTYPNLPENLQIGFNAKNVHEVIPEATGSDDKGYLTLPQGDRPIVAALVNAVQEQQKEIKQLREEIRILKKSSVPSKE